MSGLEETNRNRELLLLGDRLSYQRRSGIVSLENTDFLFSPTCTAWSRLMALSWREIHAFLADESLVYLY